MSLAKELHRKDIDIIKGLAIIAVVLYHMGITNSGYLGVDVFFVISGFLSVPAIVFNMTNWGGYLSFIWKRLLRLLPLLLVVSLACLLVGFWGMLPDDYEDLSESVVATNFFSNNILSAITVQDYWNVDNEFKPLMHTWYIGVLFEFYLFFPLIVMMVRWATKKFALNYDKYIVLTILTLSVASFLLYLDPLIDNGNKFYFLSYRFYELSFGGLAGLWMARCRESRLYDNGVLSGCALILLIVVIFAGKCFSNSQEAVYNIASGAMLTDEGAVPQTILLLLSVILTIFLLLSDNLKSFLVSLLLKTKILCFLGIMSYSVYLWHQPVLAFYRYYESSDMTLSFCFIFVIMLITVSYLSYRFFERRVLSSVRSYIILLFLFFLINGSAFSIYLHAGVVRDVPELDITKECVHRKMHAEYVDRVFAYENISFPVGKDKIKVLVIGVSFARDFANILLESEVSNKISLSYIYQLKMDDVDIIKKSDYIFIFDWKHNVPFYLWDNIRSNTEVWGIGTKNFGTSNGIIYKNRNESDYMEKTAHVSDNFYIINDMLQKEWGNRYIDLLDIATVKGHDVVAFTDNHKFMSQDNKHLTRAGAQYYSRKIDFKSIFHFE